MPITRPAAAAELAMIDKLLGEIVMAADTRVFYLPSSWLNAWRAERTAGSMHVLKPIDTESLLNEQHTAVRDGLAPGSMTPAPAEAWNLLRSWYGCGPALSRGTVQSPGDAKRFVLGEAFVIDAAAAQPPPADEAHSGLAESAPAGPAGPAGSETLAAPATAAPGSAGAGASAQPLTPKSGAIVAFTNWENSKEGVPVGGPGLCGLGNLGNTCFMNSAVQCLAHTQQLTRYFVSKRYLGDINESNPLGKKGKVARAYGDLVRALWANDAAFVRPLAFKAVIAELAAQFAGYGQHDAQELLGFLLDGLHEDLQRTRRAGAPDLAPVAPDAGDAVLAAAAWAQHRARNDSKIVDLFSGMLHSRIACNSEGCTQRSSTFDPYTMLSLPLPGDPPLRITATVIFRDSRRRFALYSIEVEQFVLIAELKHELGRRTGLRPECMFAAYVDANSEFQQFYDDESFIPRLRSGDQIHVYETADFDAEENAALTRVPLAHRVQFVSPHVHPVTGAKYVTFDQTLFGLPLMLSVERRTTYFKLREAVIDAMARYLDTNVLSEADRTLSDDERLARLEAYGQMSATLAQYLEDMQAYAAKRTGESYSDDDPDMADETEPRQSSAPQLNLDAETTLTSIAEARGELFTITVEGFDVNLVKLGVDQDIELSPDNYIVIDWNRHYFLQAYSLSRVADVEYDESMSLTQDDPNLISVRKCLTLFTECEVLRGDEMWYCRSCGAYREASKQITLYSAPPVLVLHLKRFRHMHRFGRREKVDSFVDFPLEGLDLTPFLPAGSAPAVYDLYAVCNHYGGMGGGHYTAFARDEAPDSWALFNDSQVRAVTVGQVKTSAAYVLFYKRRELAEPQ